MSCVFDAHQKTNVARSKIKAAACNDGQHQLSISESNLALKLSIQTVYMHIHAYHSK